MQLGPVMDAKSKVLNRYGQVSGPLFISLCISHWPQAWGCLIGEIYGLLKPMGIPALSLGGGWWTDFSVRGPTFT